MPIYDDLPCEKARTNPLISTKNLETDYKSVFSFAYMRGFAQRCCAQPCCMNPCRVRAGAYSHVQSRSFCYYAYGYESPHLHHKKRQAERNCLFFLLLEQNRWAYFDYRVIFLGIPARYNICVGFGGGGFWRKALILR